MRQEEEMMELIVNTAREDDRILAVYMNGSRTNVNVKEDIFRDYDIVYVVHETAPFIKDKNWIKRFGDILFMQYPDESAYFPADKANSYAWLMQFTDGNRMDLTVQKLDYARENILEDRLCRVLLDKKAYLPQMPSPTDEDHWVRRPSQKEFDCTCNEYWWCLNNVAKGLYREEISYTLDMINHYIRPMLFRMLSFLAGADYDFSISVGKSGKLMTKYLDEEIWNQYLDTFSGADREDIYTSTQKMNTLFLEVSELVAEKLKFHMNKEEAENSRSFFEHVYNLPKDAKDIY